MKHPRARIRSLCNTAHLFTNYHQRQLLIISNNPMFSKAQCSCYKSGFPSDDETLNELVAGVASLTGAGCSRSITSAWTSVANGAACRGGENLHAGNILFISGAPWTAQSNRIDLVDKEQMEEHLNVEVNKLYRFSPPPSGSLQTGPLSCLTHR